MLEQNTPNKIKSLGNFTIRKIFGAFLSTSLPLISATLDAFQGAWIEPPRACPLGGRSEQLGCPSYVKQKL